jgi:Sec-independent protein secretion pathway component TatC
METPIVSHAPAARTYRSTRALSISLLGPATTVAGVVWAFVQPERLTLLHPHGQGFWWLFAEPPLFVMLVGFLFAYFVARPLVADLEEADAAP